jgi:molybdenum cofactor cytidylyltransferase
MVRFVVMGAGKASRMGKDKLALPWGNTTVLGYVINTILEALRLLELSNTQNQPFGFEHEIVVVARKSQDIYFLASDLDFLMHHLSWVQSLSSQPLSDTIRAGLRDLREEVNGICFIPGDQVGLQPKVLAEMTRTFLNSSPDFLVPEAEEITGSPVFFHSRYVPELMALEGEQGGRGVLARYKDRWMTYPVPKEFLRDIDTKEEYEAYRERR